MDDLTPILIITIPSFFAISIKIWLIANSNKRVLILNNWPLLLAFIGTGGTNLIEFLSFSNTIQPGLLEMQFYYFALIVSFTGLFYLSANNANLGKNFHSFLSKAIGLFAVLLSMFLFGSKFLLADVHSIGYTITRTAGSGYWLFQIFALITLALSVGLNFFGLKNKRGNEQKCKATLICFLPYAVSILFTVILMQLGYAINASIIIPLATTYLLLALIYVEDKDMVFKILLWTPYSKERRNYKVLIYDIEEFLVNTSNGTKSSLKELTNKVENHIVSMAVDITNGSQIEAASLLSTSASSICRKKKTTHNEFS